ncbi:hypothetical protein [uncultured Gammaproteobacteria bacterium]|nr:hypothetical protein [uncultured Gammaproteobacteria bacterium]
MTGLDDNTLKLNLNNLLDFPIKPIFLRLLVIQVIKLRRLDLTN